MSFVISNSYFKIKFYTLIRKIIKSVSPHWLVLLADMAVVLFSYGVVLFFTACVNNSGPGGLNLLLHTVYIAATYLVVSFFVKSYTSVIRLSVIEDLYRLLIVVAISTLVLVISDIFGSRILGYPLYHVWYMPLVGIVAFSLLVMERLSIKFLYTTLVQANEDQQKKVLVLGTSFRSIALANAMKSDITGKYMPVGLLSKDHKSANKIGGFDVYCFDPDTMANTFMEKGIHALVFDSSKTKLMREGFADYFIKHNILLLTINQVEEFEDDSENKAQTISKHIKKVNIEDLLGRDPIVLNNTLVKSHIKDSVVLVTGACGSIGSEIVRQLAAYKAAKIVLVDQAETPMHDIVLEMREKFPEADVVPFMGDIQNYDRMSLAFRTYRPKYVFHAAAYKHVPMMELNPTEAVMTNVGGTKNIADLSLKYDVYKFVMVSTDKAVNPSNIMGCTKRLCEIYIQSLFFDAKARGKNTQFITTRFGNVLGSNGSVIPLFSRQIREGGPVTVTHKDIIRYFMTIPEACSLVLEAGCMGKGGEIYIFDMGQSVKIYDMAKRMISLAGLRPGIDIEIKEVGLRPGEKLYEELLNDKEKTISTPNDKIMIAKVRKYDFDDVLKQEMKIITKAEQGNVHDMVYLMKELVPEYKSLNSEFAEIDKEIEQHQSTDDE